MIQKEIALVESAHLKKAGPDFTVGDRVRVYLKVVEGDKTRTQVFEGTVIRRRGKGSKESFTVLKTTRGSQHTIEKTFPFHSPVVEKVKVVQEKKVYRSKLYHLRSVAE